MDIITLAGIGLIGLGLICADQMKAKKSRITVPVDQRKKSQKSR